MWGMKSTTIFLFAIASAAPLVTACSGDVFEGDDLLGGDAGGDALSKPDAAGGDAGNGDAVATGDGDPSGDASDGSVQAEAEAGCPQGPFQNITVPCSSSQAACLRSNSVTCESSGTACSTGGGAWMRCGSPSDCSNQGGHCCITQGLTGVAGCPNVITVPSGESVTTICDSVCNGTTSDFYYAEVCETDVDCPASQKCEYSVFSYDGGEFQHLGVCHPSS